VGDKNDKARSSPPSEDADDKQKESVAEKVPAALGEALRGAGIDPGDPKVSKAIEISLMLFSGPLPLPPPHLWEAWERTHPGVTEKIVEWTDRQSKHRQFLERLRAERSENRLDRAQFIAASVAIGGLCLSAVVGILGSPVVASIIAIVSVGGPTAATAFVAWRNGKAPSKLPTRKPPST